MPTKLKIEISLFSIFMISLIVQLVRKNLINIKYSLLWMFAILFIVISAIIPSFLSGISSLLGFELMSNFIFTFMIAILIFVMISITIIVSRQKESIRLLTQEISLLKAEVKRGNKK